MFLLNLDFWNVYNNFWLVIQTIIYVLVVLIFFMDPIRRWNFFGYRPTAVIGMFDPELKKVLLSKSNGVWSFNQGGIYEENIYLTANEILKRELGLHEYRFRLVCTKPLGTVLIKDPRLITKPQITSISLFTRMRGKGYLACFAQAGLATIESEIHKGTGIDEVKIVSFDEAKTMILQTSNAEHHAKKQSFMISMLEEIGRLSTMLKGA